MIQSGVILEFVMKLAEPSQRVQGSESRMHTKYVDEVRLSGICGVISEPTIARGLSDSGWKHGIAPTADKCAQSVDEDAS
jgi:hypothetical protein